MDSLSRHEQMLRVFHLIDILFSARHPLTTAELKERLQDRGVIDDISDKSIRRDVEFLGRFGYAVTETKKRSPRGVNVQAWAIAPGKGAVELTPPSITLPELLSLAVAREFLTPLAGTVYWRGIGQVLKKLESVATPELLDYVNDHREGLVVHPQPARARYRSRLLTAVHRAICNAQELEIRYTSLADARPKKSTIRPEALVLYDGAVYIAAYRAPFAARAGGRTRAARAADDAIRFFKLDRVADAKVTSRTFARRPEAVADLLADSITIFRSPEPPRRYRVRVDVPRARWAIEKPFHPRQKVKPQPDGSVILDIDRCWDGEMIPQLLALGEMVEVLEPADVRDRIAASAAAIVDRYAGKPRGRLATISKSG
ncbi:MAG: helix-turn-helix transcriptional regulator [Pirellulales bacterium]